MLGDPGIRKISEDVIDENHMKLGEPGMNAMSEEEFPADMRINEVLQEPQE